MALLLCLSNMTTFDKECYPNSTSTAYIILKFSKKINLAMAYTTVNLFCLKGQGDIRL